MKYCTALLLLMISKSSVTAQNEMPNPRDSYSAEAERIPLREIWAYRMPDTRELWDFQTSDGNWASQAGSLVRDIRLKLGSFREDEAASSGFAVAGVGLTALAHAHAVLTQDKDPMSEFKHGEPLSLVFFSHQLGSYVHITKVQRSGNRFTIEYRFVQHMEMEMTEHFALIPLHNLPLGEYTVDLVQRPIKTQIATAKEFFLPQRRVERLVSRPFTFSILPGQASKQGE